jgi:hypothetical protein
MHHYCTLGWIAAFLMGSGTSGLLMVWLLRRTR